MHGQQKKLNPIEDFAFPASKVPNTVSVKNPWHRWTSIGNVDRYQANEPAERPAERLENAREALEKIFGSVCFFLVCSGDEHFGSGVGCDGVEWSTPWLCHLRQLLLHVVAANACQRLPTLPTLRILRATLRSVNVETCKHRCSRATPRNAEQRRTCQTPRIVM